MPKLFLKIIAALAGLGILIYLLGRKLTDWEVAVEQEFVNEALAAREVSAAEPKPSAASQANTSAASLQQIKGIGPVIEEKLNRIGYQSLQQIAQLTREEKERIEEELSFPGRIERDQWVEQARALIG